MVYAQDTFADWRIWSASVFFGFVPGDIIEIGVFVITAQAGIQCRRLDSRLREND
jgi:hypothetical protein